VVLVRWLDTGNRYHLPPTQGGCSSDCVAKSHTCHTTLEYPAINTACTQHPTVKCYTEHQLGCFVKWGGKDYAVCTLTPHPPECKCCMPIPMVSCVASRPSPKCALHSDTLHAPRFKHCTHTELHHLFSRLCWFFSLPLILRRKKRLC